jgi:polyisoprenoid-binding protein YceI
MQKTKLLIIAATILLAFSFVAVTAINWKVKEDYQVKFKFGKYYFGSDSLSEPNGFVNGLKATITFDKDNLPNSKIIASIDATTIDTGNPSKNSSATGPDVLIAEKFPLITFESSVIVKTDKGYETTGQLTIKNISKEIKFPFVFEGEIFKGGLTIETKDFHFTHPHVPGEITVFFTIPVIQ